MESDDSDSSWDEAFANEITSSEESGYASAVNSAAILNVEHNRHHYLQGEQRHHGYVLEDQQRLEYDSGKNKYLTSHGRLADAFANAHPTPTNFHKFGCQILMFVLFAAIFAFMTYPCALWIQSSEMSYEMYRILQVRKSSDELQRYRSLFSSKLCGIFEQTNTTTTKGDEVNGNVREFFETYYYQRYKEYQDLQALDFDMGKSDKSWGIGKIIESLLSVMMLTGSDTIFYKTLTGSLLMFTISGLGSILITIVLAASSSVTILAINKCFSPFTVCKSKTKKADKQNVKFDLGTTVMADFGTLIIVTVCCAGSIFLGALAMKNDQPSWSMSDAALYTFAQSTTMGNSQFVPDRSALSQQTFYSIYFYASIRIFTMYWVTCFTLAIFKLSENIDKLTRVGLSPLDMKSISIVDQARMRNNPNVRYMN